jgi:hypothetical protein
VTPLLGRIPPIFIAIASQIIALVIVFPSAIWIGHVMNLAVPILGVLIIQGIAAALISQFAGLARWWIVLQVVLPPAGLALHQSSLPAWAYLVAFLLLVAVFWNTFGERVPLYLTNRPTIDAIDGLLPKDRPIRFIDIGCGVASVLGPLARRHPDSEFVGMESAPLPFVIGALRLWIMGRRNARLIFGSMWEHDLTPYDVAYCFLSPAPMPTIFDKANKEMAAGTLFISNSFMVPGVAPHQTLQVADSRQTQLLLWHIGGVAPAPTTGKTDELAGPAPETAAKDNVDSGASASD